MLLILLLSSTGTLTWNNTVSAVITTHRKLFKSNTRQSGFWTLLPPPGMASLVADGDSEDENVDYAEKAREMKAQSRSASSSNKKRKVVDIASPSTPKPVPVSKPISSPSAHMKAYYTDGPAPKLRKSSLTEIQQPKPLLWNSPNTSFTSPPPSYIDVSSPNTASASAASLSGLDGDFLPISVRRRTRPPLSPYFARAHVRLQATADRKAFAEMHQQIQAQLQAQQSAQQAQALASSSNSSSSSSQQHHLHHSSTAASASSSHHSASASSSASSATSSSSSSSSSASSTTSSAAMDVDEVHSSYHHTIQQSHRTVSSSHSDHGNGKNSSDNGSSSASSTATNPSSVYGVPEYISPSHLSHRGSHSLSSATHSPEDSPRRSITPEDLLPDPFYLDSAMSNSATAHLNEPMDHMMSTHSSAYASYSTPTSTNVNGGSHGSSAGGGPSSSSNVAAFESSPSREWLPTKAYSSGTPVSSSTPTLTTVAGPSMTYNPNMPTSSPNTIMPSSAYVTQPNGAGTNGTAYPSPSQTPIFGGYGTSNSPSLAHLSGTSPHQSSSSIGSHGVSSSYGTVAPSSSLPTRQAKINAANNLMVATAGLNSNSQSVSIMLKSNVPHRGRNNGADKGFPYGAPGTPGAHYTDAYGQPVAYGGQYTRVISHPQVTDPVIIPLPNGWFERALKNPSLRKRVATQEIELPVWRELNEDEERELWEDDGFDGSDEEDIDDLKYLLNHREYEKEEKKLKKLCL